MAKFCTKCGKKLEEGQVCDCQKNKKEGTTLEATTQNIDIKESFMDCVNVFKSIFTKPIDAIKEFVCDNKYIAGIIMIVLAAISNGLYKIAILKNSYQAVNTSDFSSLLSSALSGSLTSSEPEYLKEFLTSFITNFIEYALIALIGYVIISKLLKGTASVKQMITAVAISLSVVLVGNVLNSVLVFIDGDFITNIRSYVSSFAYIISILILYKSVSEIAEIDKNKLFVSVASMSVLATLVIDVFEKLFN
jgi:hypothetical protein